MRTLAIKIKRTKSGRTFMDLFSKNEDGFEILDSPYDPEFVAKIKEKEKGLKGDKL